MSATTLTSPDGSKMVSTMDIDHRHDKDEIKKQSPVTSGSVAFGASTISSLSQDATTKAVVSSSSSSSIDPSSTHALSSSTVSGLSQVTKEVEYYQYLTDYKAGLKVARRSVLDQIDLIMKSDLSIPVIKALLLTTIEGVIRGREDVLNLCKAEFSKNRAAYNKASIDMSSRPPEQWDRERLGWYSKYFNELSEIIKNIDEEVYELLQLRIKHGINAQTTIKFYQPPFIPQ